MTATSMTMDALIAIRLALTGRPCLRSRPAETGVWAIQHHWHAADQAEMPPVSGRAGRHVWFMARYRVPYPSVLQHACPALACHHLQVVVVGNRRTPSTLQRAWRSRCNRGKTCAGVSIGKHAEARCFDWGVRLPPPEGGGKRSNKHAEARSYSGRLYPSPSWASCV
jgi:hypothetical protein